MLSQVYSAALQGIDAVEVEIQVNEGAGNPKFILVGLPDAAVRESRDRVLTAIANSGLRVPKRRTTVSLAPADLKKEGPSFDLPIALGVVALAGTGFFPEDAFEKCAIAGELALNGEIRPVKGALSMALEARERGRRAIILPRENAAQAACVEGIYFYPADTLSAAVDLLRGNSGIRPLTIDRASLFETATDYPFDFSEVKGQSHVRRALEVAVAGAHNLLLAGPPGTGKSMMAKRMVTLMPPMAETEAIETTKIHSVAGILGPSQGLLTTRPFRSPHHTISDAGLLGGTSYPSPGEVSLAHHGILFLDELTEFRRSTLEVMRQPLEDGKVTISRAAGSYTFPSQFMLVAAMNPCPCGYLGDPRRECQCSGPQIEKYRSKISGPLLDRIDLQVEVPAVPFEELSSARPGESSATVRERILDCRRRQAARFHASPAVNSNAAMSPKDIERHCSLSAACQTLLREAMDDLQLSARAYHRILKVARTLADLDHQDPIGENHVLEAIGFRSLDRRLWN